MSEHVEDEKLVTSQNTVETEEATETSEVTEESETAPDENDAESTSEESKIIRFSTLTLYFVSILIGVNMGASIPSKTHAMPEWYHILGGAVILFGLLKWLTRDSDFEGLAKLHAPLVVPSAFVASSLIVLVTGSTEVATMIALIAGLLLLATTLVACGTILMVCRRHDKVLRECEEVLKNSK